MTKKGPRIVWAGFIVIVIPEIVIHEGEESIVTVGVGELIAGNV